MIRRPGRPEADNADAYEAIDEAHRAQIDGVVEAVCAELGLGRRPDERRMRVKHGIVSTWRDGRRQPLNLVSAGLDAIGV